MINLQGGSGLAGTKIRRKKRAQAPSRTRKFIEHYDDPSDDTSSDKSKPKPGYDSNFEIPSESEIDNPIS